MSPENTHKLTALCFNTRRYKAASYRVYRVKPAVHMEAWGQNVKDQYVAI